MNIFSTAANAFAGLLLIIFLLSGFFMGKKVKSSAEFDKGGKSSGTLLVMGSIIGTLVGGASTVGTAQLAFTSGFSALWFTFGSSIGCVILAIFLSKPLRNSDVTTIVGLVSHEYGQKTGTVAAILSSFGLMINLIAQILSANALLTALFPINPSLCGIISAGMMFLYVFGGVKGTGYLGIMKTALLYLTVAASAILCIFINKGFSGFGILPSAQYFNFFARGFGIDMGAGLSVALGVVSTQTYIQSVLSARSNLCAKKGVLLSALIIPFIGIGSLLIGYFMRINFPDLIPAQAFPQFIITYMPPFVSQLMIVVLLITVLGTGAGISLGLSSTISNDLIKKLISKDISSKKTLLISRAIVLFSLLFAVLITQSSVKSAILTWSFMSMGLRAVVLLVPMLCALFLPGITKSVSAIASICIGLITMMLVFLSPISEKIDPLILGMAVVLVVYLIAALISRSSKLCNKKENLHV